MSLSDALKAAVGIGSKALVAKQDSYLKRFPLQSSELHDDQKLAVNRGFQFQVFNCKTYDNHYMFDTSDPRFLGHGFAFVEHFELLGGDVPKQLVTAEQFYAIAPQTSLSKLAPLVDPLNVALAKYNINTPLRICHFLAQTCHESDQFNTTEEYASGSEYNDRPDLGNTSDGDGERYKGRSFIQITGKYNYQDFSNYLGVDFVSKPELLATPDYAWLGAGWFWEKNQLNDLADSDRFRDITIAINGGINGVDSRLEALNRAKQIFGI